MGSSSGTVGLIDALPPSPFALRIDPESAAAGVANANAATSAPTAERAIFFHQRAIASPNYTFHGPTCGTLSCINYPPGHPCADGELTECFKGQRRRPFRR